MITPADVSIIIGTHNQPDCLKVCLTTLFGYTRSDYELILVLNQVKQRTHTVVREMGKLLHTSIKTIENKKNNKSFAEWNNDASYLVSRPYTLFLNDDTVLTYKWLDSMLDMVNKNPDIVAISKALINPETQQMTVAPTGTCLLVKSEYALFDETYTGYYYEDMDLINRIIQAGFKVAVETNYPIFHYGRTTSDTRNDMEFLQADNNKIFQKKWKGKYLYKNPLDNE